MGPQVFCQREVGRGSGPWDLKCSARERLGEAVAHGTSSVLPERGWERQWPMGPQVFYQREAGRGSGPWDLKCSARSHNHVYSGTSL